MPEFKLIHASKVGPCGAADEVILAGGPDHSNRGIGFN